MVEVGGVEPKDGSMYLRLFGVDAMPDGVAFANPLHFLLHQPTLFKAPSSDLRLVGDNVDDGAENLAVDGAEG